MNAGSRVRVRPDRSVHSPLNGVEGVIRAVGAGGRCVVALDSPSITVELSGDDLEEVELTLGKTSGIIQRR